MGLGTWQKHHCRWGGALAPEELLAGALPIHAGAFRVRGSDPGMLHPSQLQMLISNPKQCFPSMFVICDGIYRFSFSS